jgi:hypothetical protein
MITAVWKLKYLLKLMDLKNHLTYGQNDHSRGVCGQLGLMEEQVSLTVAKYSYLSQCIFELLI